jgi:murein L,D-transpeptidase YcbB/YkuD
MIMRWCPILALLLLLVAPASLAQPPTLDPVPDSLADGGVTARFYQLHGGQMAWSGSPRALADARVARAVLAGAAQDGLEAGRYGAFAGGTAVADDVALSAALLAYMRDVADGRPDLRALDSDVALPPRVTDVAALLDEALRHGQLAAVLESLPPHNPDYIFLKAALGDAQGDVHDTIVANMERWRWLPPQLEPDRIMINAADASLDLWLGGAPVLRSRVIVGKPATPTPILRAEGAAVTVNPAWTVPHSIAVKELLPRLKKNRAYLASQQMVLLNGPPGDPHGLTVNWRAIRAGQFPYQVRQLPGGRNALGRLKLELPNRFDVYLHDTPSRALFARPARALSHGCVRVEQILPLASYAISADGSALEDIRRRIDGGATTSLPLQRRLPVYFLYWTAFARDGRLVIRPDVYGRDSRLVAAAKAQPLRVAALDACQRG